MERAKKTHCVNGHEFAVVGKNKFGRCNYCRKISSRTWKSRNKERVSAHQKTWRSKQKLLGVTEDWKVYRSKYPEKRKILQRKHRLKQYGITVEEYNLLLEKQQGVCAICKTFTVPKNQKNLCVDHNHLTGKVRELLCYNCNYAIGYLKDNINTAINVVKYLEKHNAG